jgi:hypothetical protein
MYESIPPEPDTDGNLVLLPVTRGHGFRADVRQGHQERVAQFFAERLGSPGAPGLPVAASAYSP